MTEIYNNNNSSTKQHWTPPWGSALPPPVRKATSSTTVDPDKLCGICFEAEATITLDACRQKSCQCCLATWFVKHPQRPTCPLCLNEVQREALVELLGMDPVVGAGSAAEAPHADEQEEVMDDLTQDWLQEQSAAQCPQCSIWIIKDGGCNHMTCFCGHEYCWFCLSKDLDCDCCSEEEETDDEDDSDDE